MAASYLALACFCALKLMLKCQVGTLQKLMDYVRRGKLAMASDGQPSSLGSQHHKLCRFAQGRETETIHCHKQSVYGNGAWKDVTQLKFLVLDEADDLQKKDDRKVAFSFALLLHVAFAVTWSVDSLLVHVQQQFRLAGDSSSQCADQAWPQRPCILRTRELLFNINSHFSRS